jgi:hypothetical protein
MRHRIVAPVLVCLGLAAPALHAQDDPDPSERARFRLGAIRFTPSIALSNIGFDNNVFNEAEDPKQDTTAAVGPAIDLWVKMGPSRLSGKASGQYLYFNKYDNQRSWNTNAEGRWELPLARVTPYVEGRANNTKDRPGYEIDSRVRLKQEQAGAGTSIRVSGKTSLVFGASRTRIRYDDDDLFLGDLIATSLDRESDNQEAQLRLKLTPLTTFVVRAEAAQDRFVYEPSRDANSVTVMPGFDLKPEALVSGQVFVGVRHFDGLRESLPDYTGTVADVAALYSVRATQLQLHVSRDLVFSYELLQPYYAQIDTGVTVVQRVTNRWDIVGRGGRQTLGYKNLVASALPERTDHSWQLGAGLGYRPTETLRIGLDAIYLQRETASRALRNYEGFRVGASFSYGLIQ